MKIKKRDKRQDGSATRLCAHQYRNAWDFKTGFADTTRLNVPTPWYSYTYNDVIDSNHTEAVSPTSFGGVGGGGGTYYGLAHSSISQHLLGQKQYELTNHLGNVQAAISDKRYVKTTSGGTVRDYFNASIVAAYDYYPYGMLMPDRFVSDTATHCVTTTQTRMVPVKTSTSVLATAIAINGGSIVAPPFSTGTTIGGNTGGMQIDIPVTAGVPIDISINIGYIYGSFISLSLSENLGLGTYKALANTNANYPSTVTLSATPSTTTMRLSINMMSSYITAPPGGLFSIADVVSEKTTYETRNVLVTLCNKGADKYEFGFNTQMKSNEVAGIGNWNTAAYWEYNTRTGIRANRDPVFAPWESPYCVNGGNPIFYKDPFGDYKSKFNARVANLLRGGSGIAQNTDKNSSHYGEWYSYKNSTHKHGVFTKYNDKYGGVNRTVDFLAKAVSQWGPNFYKDRDRFFTWLNSTWMGRGNTFEKKENYYDKGSYGEVMQGKIAENNETRISQYVGPYIMDYYAPGIGAGFGLGKFSPFFDAVSNLASGAENTAGVVSDAIDYYNKDKPLIRKRSVEYLPNGGMRFDMRPGTDTNGYGKIMQEHLDSLYKGQIKVK